jgi:hypothetical protein
MKFLVSLLVVIQSIFAVAEKNSVAKNEAQAIEKIVVSFQKQRNQPISLQLFFLKSSNNLLKF